MSEQHEHTEELKRIREEAMNLLQQAAELASALTAAIDRQIGRENEDKKKRRHLYVVPALLAFGASIGAVAAALGRYALKRPVLTALATIAAIGAIAAAVILPHQNTASPSLPQAVPSHGLRTAPEARTPSPAPSPVASKAPLPAPVVAAYSPTQTASPSPSPSHPDTTTPSPSPSAATPSPSPSPSQSCLVNLLNLVCVNLAVNVGGR